MRSKIMYAKLNSHGNIETIHPYKWWHKMEDRRKVVRVSVSFDKDSRQVTVVPHHYDRPVTKAELQHTMYTLARSSGKNTYAFKEAMVQALAGYIVQMMLPGDRSVVVIDSKKFEKIRKGEEVLQDADK